MNKMSVALVATGVAVCIDLATPRQTTRAHAQVATGLARLLPDIDRRMFERVSLDEAADPDAQSGDDGTADRPGPSWSVIERTMKADVVDAMRIAAGHHWGAAYAWTVDERVIGAMVVFGAKAPEGFAPETEYHAFAPAARSALHAAHTGHMQLRMQRVSSPGRTLSDTKARGDGFAARNPRTFVADESARHIVADPKRGRFLFHVASRVPGQTRVVDHYLEVRLSAHGAAPSLSWYVEKADFAVMATALMATEKDWRCAAQWQVAPIGDGVLSPVDEVVGHELAPMR